MIRLEQYVGQVLDEKYRLERLLGQGGMGAVYLATHLGTERYVALKLIAPQFMRNQEFVERFKREARAAGRLRHPNVVDVTDFGFARANGEPVAYLVMEYLDGCTLGDVLQEDKQLPLEWVVSIIEQACSAVQEAHQQGIVHRDLKPDNIWLEPNRLGGYRVKVLDFGIAKLAESDAGASTTANSPVQSANSAAHRSQIRSTAARKPAQSSNGKNLENETLMFPRAEPEVQGALESPAPLDPLHSLESDNTKLFVRKATEEGESPSPQLEADDGDHTLMLKGATRQAPKPHTTMPAASTQGTELTRVGAIMGTPVYMSPEQCAAKPLDARADIYSLGVITYQMLAGEPPFSGDTNKIMQDHVQATPLPLRERSKKVPKRVAQVVMSALAKDPAQRPQTAAVFGYSLRAHADGVGSLYRRAFALYSEYFPKFLRLSLIAHIPVIVFTLLLILVEVYGKAMLVRGATVYASDHVHVSATVPSGGKIALIIAVAVLALLQVVSAFVAAAAISGLTAVMVTQLSLAPMRPVELRTAVAVLKRRWRPFLKTSFRVMLRIVIGLALLFIPGIVMSARYALYAPVVVMEGLEKKAAMRRARELASRSWRTVIIVSVLQILIPMTVSVLIGRLPIGAHQGSVVGREVYQQLAGLSNIVIVPFMSIVPALVYLRMRQLGGEAVTETLAQLDDVDVKRSRWQQRMRTRTTLHPPRTQTPAATGKSIE